MTRNEEGLAHGWAASMRNGQMDDGNMVGIALAAIKHGRVLETSDRITAMRETRECPARTRPVGH